MGKDRTGSSSQLSDKASEPDPGLQWWKGWMHAPQLLQLFTPPPTVALLGEVEEVRIRRMGKEGAFMVQLGVRASRVEANA